MGLTGQSASLNWQALGQRETLWQKEGGWLLRVTCKVGRRPPHVHLLMYASTGIHTYVFRYTQQAMGLGLDTPHMCIRHTCPRRKRFCHQYYNNPFWIVPLLGII